MATGYRSVSSYANSQAAPGRLLPVPAGTTTDDIVIVYANCWLSAAAAFTWSISGGNGTWTQIVNANYAPDDGQLYASVWAKRTTSADSGNYTIGGWTGSQWTEAVAITISGIPNTVPLADAVSGTFQAQASAATAYPTISTGALTATDPALVWFGDSYDYDADTPPTGWTERFDGSQTISAATRLPAAAGTYSTAGASHAGTTFGASTLIIVRNSVAVAPNAGAGSGGITWAGSATGISPAVGVNSGAGIGAIGWAGSAQGTTSRSGAGSGSIEWAGSGVGQSIVRPFVTAVSANGRYFEDQNGDPLLVKGDSPWSAFSDLSTSQWNTYCTNRSALGFNAMLCSLIGSVANGGPNNDGRMYDGVLPFVGGNVLNWNETYWSRIDTFLDIAESYGITIFLYVVDGWTISTVFSAVSAATCTTFGEMVADRFAGRPNLVWMFGGDYAGDTTNDGKMGGALAGIRSTGDTRLASCQLIYQRTWTTQRAYWSTRADFDFVYSYPVQYDATYAAYNAAPTIPSLWMEGHYGGENDGFSATNVKRQAGWAMTQGSPGHFFGSDDWEFHSGWETRLNSLFAPEVSALAENVEAIPRWWDLAPSRTFITSGAGTLLDASGVGQTNDPSVDPSQSTYATAAITADGKVALVYLPTQRAITINSAALATGAVGRWIKADNAAVTGAAGSLSGSMTPPSSGDWLLAIEAPASGVGSGGITWSGSAAGVGTQQGAGNGTITWSGSATGVENPVAAGSGAITYAATATGEHQPVAAGSGGIGWSGSATGSAPVVGSNSGAALGVITWDSFSTGVRQPVSAGAGGVTWAGAADGFAPFVPPAVGAGVGSVAWEGTAAGTAPGEWVPAALDVGGIEVGVFAYIGGEYVALTPHLWITVD